MTSPVDFISGPRAMSTFLSFPKENTGIFTAYCFSSGRRPRGMFCFVRLTPKMAWVAISAMGIPVILLRKGTVLELLGFTSSTKTLPLWSTTNWML